MIDGHIHYIEYMGADRLNQIVEEYHYDGIALQCIPDSAGREVLGMHFATESSVRCRSIYLEESEENYTDCLKMNLRQHLYGKRKIL